MEKTEEKKDKKKTIILVIVLVLIIISVIVILGYQKFFTTNTEQTEIIPLENQISEYEGDEISGDNVKLLLAKIISDNLASSNSGLLKIEYNIKTETEENYIGNIDISSKESGQNIQDIINLRNAIMNEDIYKIEYGKENDIIISVIIKSKNS